MSRLGAIAASVAPAATVTWRHFRGLETAPARALFLRRLRDRGLLGRLDRLPVELGGSPLVLFVCHGNIMRSALAEAALRQALGSSRVRVASAGTAATSGREADPRAKAYATAAGLDMSGHRARLIDLPMARASEIIFALDRRIEAQVASLDPALEARTLLLGGISPSGGYSGYDIEDPFSLAPDRATRSFDQVMESVKILAGRLQ